MAFYPDEEEVWKCPKHPSKRRRSGICPTCLRERLVGLCPDCANVRPCSCCPTATNSSTSSSSSSFSLFSSRDGLKSASGIGAIDRVSNLIDSEPAFRRSRSVAIPFFRSRFAEKDFDDRNQLPPVNRDKSSFWSMFKSTKAKKEKEEQDEGVKVNGVEEDETAARMLRSRSVGFSLLSHSRSVRSKLRSWHIPSPMKAFRQSKTSKVVNERSPMYRG